MTRVLLFDINPAMVQAWDTELEKHNLPLVETAAVGLDEMIEQFNPAAISSAGNPYGVLGSGIDGALKKRLPWAQPRITSVVANKYQGIMPVGNSEPIWAPIDPSHQDPSLFYTPTMPNPGMDVESKVMASNVYMATRAVVQLANRTMGSAGLLAIPGMGTGVGRLPLEVAAEAQAKALVELAEWKA